MMANYTTLTKEQKDCYEEKFRVERFTMKDAREDVTKFAYFMLGIKLFDYQDLIANNKSNRLIVCSSRQIGKSTVVAVMALHHALFKSGQNVIVVSPTLDQSRKLLGMIRDLIYKGDMHMKQFHKKMAFFSGQINNRQEAVNTSQQISFENKSLIKSVPAAESARGNTANLLIEDEAGFMDDEIHEKILEPTVSFTGGKIILLSTPNGSKGYFYKFFDPEDEQEERERDYDRFWFNWDICPNPVMRQTIEKRQASLDRLTFQQEYEALFTVSKSNFFESDSVDGCVKFDSVVHKCKDVCFLGVDWGVKVCHTVISIGTIVDSKFRLLYQHEFPTGHDNRQVVSFIESLMNDFNITKIVTDDCSLADPFNREMEEKGWEVVRFDFNKQKISTYSFFKDWVNLGKIELPNISELLKEMKSLQYERSDVTGVAKIHKPQTGWDDRVDSLVMCFSPMIDMGENTYELLLV